MQRDIRAKPQLPYAADSLFSRKSSRNERSLKNGYSGYAGAGFIDFDGYAGNRRKCLPVQSLFVLH